MKPMHDAMLHAIKGKRGSGFDVQMIINGHHMDVKPVVDGEGKTGEMAPDAPVIDAHKSPMEVSPMEENGESPQDEQMEQSSMDKEMMDHVGHEPPPDHKPRSLGERAKMALFSRMGKK